nr:aldo/keto reductase [Pseudonocardia terrae]
MRTRTLGRTGPAVSALGLGAMSMSGAYGPADRTESIATVHAALDAGVTLIDTGDFYAMGHNELLLGQALRGRDRDDYVLSVKFGGLAGPGLPPLKQDCRPAAVKNSADRVLADLARRGGRDPPDPAGAGHRPHGLRRPRPRPHLGPLHRRPDRTARRLPRP